VCDIVCNIQGDKVKNRGSSPTSGTIFTPFLAEKLQFSEIYFAAFVCNNVCKKAAIFIEIDS
jgi:hypothetical protein